MPALAIAKRDTGRRLHSRAVVADGNQTKLCAYLSAILLGGLVLNAMMGWWRADPVAALGIAGLALNEGREAWRGDACCDWSPHHSGVADGCTDDLVQLSRARRVVSWRRWCS
jgi:hypothetical protein